jgi:hypothetical protein
VADDPISRVLRDISAMGNASESRTGVGTVAIPEVPGNDVKPQPKHCRKSGVRRPRSPLGGDPAGVIPSSGHEVPSREIYR